MLSFFPVAIAGVAKRKKNNAGFVGAIYHWTAARACRRREPIFLSKDFTMI